MKKYLLLSFMLMFAFVYSDTWAQQRTISGKVTSVEDGSSLPGVNVVLKGTTAGTVTDIDGNYSLSVSTSGGTLVFSFVGLQTEEVEIGARSVIDIQMTTDIKQLSEVVVQAYGAQSEKLNVQQIETVSSKDFENFPVLSAQEALQGQAGGVQITGASGVIGTAQSVRIRGVASINSGTQPLYVVDGVPLNDASGGTEGYGNNAGAGTAPNPIFDINPGDIESMTVLKDASAVALYGSRGANGVILINTKKGAQNQKTVFSVDYFTGWSEPTTLRNALSADQYRQFRANLSTARGTPSSPGRQSQGGFNWRNAVLETGRTTNYAVSARGGTEKTAFYVGGSLFDATSYQIGNDVTRLSGRINLSHEATDFVRFGTNVSFTRSETDRFNEQNSTGSPLTVGYLQLPFLEPFDEDGNFQDVGFDNPLGAQELNTFVYTTNRLLGNAYAEFEPMEGLVLKTDWGVDRIFTDNETRTVDLFFAGGLASREVITDNKYLTTNTASYFKNFGSHTITPLVGFSFEKSERSDVEVASQQFISDALPNVISGAEPTTTESTGTEWALWSMFGRVNYNYADKYVFEASLRRDGSSRFGDNNRWGTFWAVTGGWLFSEEDFFPQSDIVTFGKLSASYGVTGNDRIDNFAPLGLFTAGNDYDGNPGLEADQPANPDLTWEETAQLDISLNLHFLRDKVRLDASYYRKTTTELLLDVPVPATTGFADITQNAGELVNQGIDISLSADVIDQGDWRWTVTANMGYLNNEVTNLPDGSAEDPDGNKFVALTAFSSQRAIEGHSVAQWFLNRYAGVNPTTGDAEYLTRDGERTTNLSTSDRAILGSGIPDLSGGLNSVLTYKGFEFRVFANFVSGSETYVSGNEFVKNMIGSGIFNNTVDVLDYWQTPGQNAAAPALWSETLANYDGESTLHLFDASYLRIKNITLAYNLPQSLLRSTGFLTRARVYTQVLNAFTFFSDLHDAGIDPETNNGGTTAGRAQGETFFTAPQARTLTVGVSIGF